MNVRIRGLPTNSIYFSEDQEFESAPVLKDKYLVGVSGTKSLGATGGQSTVTESHTHTVSVNSNGWAYILDSTAQGGNFSVTTSHSHTSSTSGSTSVTVGEPPNQALYGNLKRNVRAMIHSEAIVMGEDIPAPFKRITDYDGDYIVCKGDTHTGFQAGANTVTHSHSFTTGGVTSQTGTTNQGASGSVSAMVSPTPSHTHSGTLNSTTVEVTPLAKSFMLLKLGDVLNVRGEIPSGVEVGYYGDVIPDGWEEDSDMSDRFIKSGTDGLTGNPLGSHTHSGSVNSTNTSSVGIASGNGLGAYSNHSHSISSVSTDNILSQNYEPPYFAVHFIRKI